MKVGGQEGRGNVPAFAFSLSVVGLDVLLASPKYLYRCMLLCCTNLFFFFMVHFTISSTVSVSVSVIINCNKYYTVFIYLGIEAILTHERGEQKYDINIFREHRQLVRITMAITSVLQVPYVVENGKG